MKLTKENATASCYEFSYGKECTVSMELRPSLGTKVVEVPKFWRENGKQYKVTKFGALLPSDYFDYKILLRVPWGCEVFHRSFMETNYKIEYYD